MFRMFRHSKRHGHVVVKSLAVGRVWWKRFGILKFDLYKPPFPHVPMQFSLQQRLLMMLWQCLEYLAYVGSMQVSRPCTKITVRGAQLCFWHPVFWHRKPARFYGKIYWVLAHACRKSVVVMAPFGRHWVKGIHVCGDATWAFNYYQDEKGMEWMDEK